jgi:hypothetical protein
MAVSTYAVRRAGPAGLEVQPWIAVFGTFAVALGMLVAAGSLADDGNSIVAGLVVGALSALLGYVAVRELLVRTRKRLDADAAGALTLYAEGAALLAAGLSVLFPPLALLVIGALIALLLGGRRRTGEKYAGLRILR